MTERKLNLTPFWLLLAAVMLIGCNLSRALPTPTPAPTSAFPTPIVDPAATPIIVEGPDGQPCVVPAGWIRYVVETGDTMSLLAEQTGSTVNQLANGNCFGENDVHNLFTDQVIYLPRQPVLGQ
jgi:hypothetical protein